MSEGPLVGILVGSESDRERMEGATKTLDEAGVAYEFEVRSAHRTPDSVAEYAKTARERTEAIWTFWSIVRGSAR